MADSTSPNFLKKFRRTVSKSVHSERFHIQRGKIMVIFKKEKASQDSNSKPKENRGG